MLETMYAAVIHEYGGPERLIYEAVPRPVPTGNEVLVKIHAAGVNPIDYKTRQGSGLAGRLPDPFPLILGWDVSGVVEAIGTTVTKFKIGDEVYGMVNFPGAGGGYAEYVTAPPSQLVHKPKSLDHSHAAGVPLVALTAWQALFEAGDLAAGQRLLIHAAAGGVGHIAVQLAKWKGAYTIGTASERNESFLHDLGLDEFVNHHITPFEQVVSNVDLVLDPLGGDARARSWQVLKPGGLLVSIVGAPSPPEGRRGKNILVQANPSQLNEITRLIDAGVIKPHLDTVFPLQDASKAHELIEQGHTRGKIILKVRDSLC